MMYKMVVIKNILNDKINYNASNMALISIVSSNCQNIKYFNKAK